MSATEPNVIRGDLPVPGHTILDIPPARQELMPAQPRRARYGHLLAPHILLPCAAGRTPTAIASALFRSRTGVYRVAAAYRRRQLDLGDVEVVILPRQGEPGREVKIGFALTVMFEDGA